MMRSTFSMTTMASSTTMPIASTRPNNVSTLIDIPNASNPRNVPMTLTGTASIGISVARQLWRKRNTTSVTRIIASTSVIVTSWIDALTNGVVSNGNAHVHALREAGLHLVQPVHDRLLHRERVRAGAHVEQHERRRLAVQASLEVVASRAEHRPADVAQANRPSRPGARGSRCR